MTFPKRAVPRVQVQVRFEPDLLAEIDAYRGTEPRNRTIARLLRAALDEEVAQSSREVAASMRGTA